MKKTIIKFTSIIFFPIVYFLLFLKKVCNIRFGLLDLSRIGHATSFSMNYLIEKKVENSSYIDILFCTHNVSNNFIKKKLTKKIFFIDFFFFYKIVSYFYKYILKRDFDDIKFNINSLSQNHLTDKLINFDKEEENLVKNELSKLNINPQEKWICIHNRDDAYLNLTFPKRDWSYHNYRNFPINDLSKVCKRMIENGYTVIRVGNIVKEPIDFKHSKLIDYHLLKNKSELLESYFLTNAHLYFGSDSGIFNLAMVNKIPFCFVNFPSITNMVKYYNWNSVPFIFKLRKNQENKILSLSKVFESQLDNIFILDDFKKKGIQLVNNSPDDIADLFSEINQSDKSKEEHIQNTEDKYLEKKFWEIFESCSKIDNFPKIKPKIGKKFLKNHSYILQ